MADKRKHMTTTTAVLFAVAAGLAVGNLYWTQPLLAQIAGGFGLPASQGGLLVMATQVGYAVGALLIVPLGDVLHRRKLVGVAMGSSAIMLALCSVAPSFSFLALALAGLGLLTVSGQILLPLAGDLAAPLERGRIVGIVSSGVTTGILVSRFVSGVVADIWGWRAIYIASAVINLVMMLVMIKRMPVSPKGEKVSYPRLIAGVFTSLGRYRVMPRILIINGLAFGISFNLFWTALTFLLAAAPFGYNTFQIGLVSLAGITGSFAAVGCGKLQDKGVGVQATGAFVAGCALCMALSSLCSTSIIALVVLAALFSLAIQGVSILNQTRIFSLSNTERSRLNTAFVVNNFIFCAIGSALATVLWNAGGWVAVSAGAASACLIALAVWAASRKLFLENERHESGSFVAERCDV